MAYSRGIDFNLNTNVTNLSKINSLQNSLTKLAETQNRLNKMNFSGQITSIGGVTNATENLKNETQRTTTSFGGMGNMINKLASGIYIFKSMASAVRNVTEEIDQMSLIQSRLRLMNDGLMTTDQLTNAIYQSASRSRGSFEDTANMVGKLGLLAGEAFKNNQEIVDFAEQLNKQMKIAGTDTIQAKSAMLQLTQALASGRLQGDEFRSIMETMPTIVQSLAKELDVPKGKVKQLASEGKITAQVLKNAVLNSADEMNKKFAQVPMTFGQAMMQGMNEIKLSIMQHSHIFGNMLSSGMMGGIIPFFQGLGQLLNGMFVGFASSMVAVFNGIGAILSPIGDFLMDMAVKFGLVDSRANAFASTMKVIGTLIGIGIVAWLVYKGVMIVVSGITALFGIISKIAMGGAIAGVSILKLAVIGLILALFIVPFVIGLIVGDWTTGISYMVATVVAFCVAVVQIALLIYDSVVNIVVAISWFIASIIWWIVGNIFDGAVNIMDFINGMCQVISRDISSTGYFIQGIWETIVGAIQNAFGGMIQTVTEEFESFVNSCIRGVNMVIRALNKIPKVNIGEIGEVNFSAGGKWGNDNLATAKSSFSKGNAMMNKEINWNKFNNKFGDVSQQGQKGINQWAKGSFQTNADLSKIGSTWSSTQKNVQAWFKKPKDMGNKLGGKSPFDKNLGLGGKTPTKGLGGKGGKTPKGSKIKTPKSLGKTSNPLSKIASDTGAIKQSVATSEEDLKYLLDVAKRDAINRYGMTEIKIDMTNHNNVSNDMDLDGMVDKLNNKLKEKLLTSAEEVHY